MDGFDGLSIEHEEAVYKSAAIAIVAAIIFWWIPIFIARDGRRPGECVDCGYDLRGSPSNTCPECGAKDSRKA